MRHPTRWMSITLVTGGIAGLLATIPSEPSAAATSEPEQSCIAPRSWVAGTTDLCAGTLVYHDYVNDDYGADTGTTGTTSRTASFAPTAGDQRYPGGVDATADLVRLRIEVSGTKLLFSAELNALYESDSTTVGVAIDSDDDASTGGGRWGALDVVSDGWDVIAFSSDGDPLTNTVSGSMPLPSGSRWRVQAVAAIRGSGQVMNVAFRGPVEGASAQGVARRSDSGSWFEDDQAAALGAGDISRFGASVDVADLVQQVTRKQDVGPGLHERVYTSDYTIPPGEGVDVAGVPGRGSSGRDLRWDQSFQYLGRYQPYGIYLPSGDGPFGMQMVFHGSGSSMSALINQPGMQQQFGENLNRVLVVPEARGQNGWGSDISERDLLDVMADVEANYPVDSEQVFSGGYSQGGYVAYRMAELYPDRFAGLVSWVGFTGSASNGLPLAGTALDYSAGAIGNALELVGNLRHVPAAMLYAAEDEVIHAWTALGMERAFAETDNRYRFYLHPVAEHLTLALLDDWRKEAAYLSHRKLVRDPARVTFRTATYLDDPAHGIVHDRAYWLSDIVGRTSAYADVDLATHACGGSEPILGKSFAAGLKPVPWTSTEQSAVGYKAVGRAALLTGSLSNVASVTVDAGRTCLEGGRFDYRITTDGPATLVLSDGRHLRLTSSGTHTGSVSAPSPED